ncbi:CBS domain-containing protein [Streptomyces sp. R302]|uniref:CBS domain-containing protein n=1 Tax=unclassified Streptomyces TaxID=2593676 RepID=UPI00145E83D6|nr:MULTISPECIES: CBS domain-containing protein [unclassified Streptomyces]NML54300.1 CBS domain-containing protein [Streptomyces sp. R301]NML78474.1 CBS domain-containing protein [Streptomyces sp. R302]
MAKTPSAQQLLDLKGQDVPVLELLDLFDERVRDNPTCLRIQQTLNAAGLSTVPYFGTCARRASVHMVALDSATIEPDPQADEDEEDAEEPEDPAGSLPERPLSIGDVLNGDGVDSLPPNSPLNTVTHVMRHNNYSQLPIIEGKSTLRGVVTWRSVARMYEQGSVPTLANASEAPSDWAVAQESQDFFALLPMISEYGYALIRRNDGTIGGIVTAADITERFAGTARPFFLVGEIELRLRKCLGTAIGPDAIRAVQRKYQQTGQISDLTFGEYVMLIDGEQRKESLRPLADQNWLALKWSGADRVQFVRRLKRVKDIRNKIAHFDPQPLPDHMHEELHRFCLLLRQYVTDV